MFADSRSDYMVMVRYYAAFITTPLHYAAELPGRGLNVIGSLFETRNQLQRENARLQEQLLMQQYQLQKLEHLTAENQRLNELLNASAVVKEDVVRVEIVGESPDPFSKRILIGKGATDGVHIGQAVFDADGLMGQVVEVQPFASWVLLVTDPQHATPVQINRNGMRAIASGTRDSLHLLNLDNIPNTADVQVGDELVTSGLGERFPPGYRVGIVSSVTYDPGKPFATVVVTPTAQIDRSRNLLLVSDSRTNPAGAGGDTELDAISTDVAPDSTVSELPGEVADAATNGEAADSTQAATGTEVPAVETSRQALPAEESANASSTTNPQSSPADSETSNNSAITDTPAAPQSELVPEDEGAD